MQNKHQLEWARGYLKPLGELTDNRLYTLNAVQREFVRIAQAIIADAEAEQPSKVNRLEIIDHTLTGGGRAYAKWEDKPFDVEFSYQDDGRTLKLFLKDAE